MNMMSVLLNYLPIQSSLVQFIVSFFSTRNFKLFITTDFDVQDNLNLVTFLSGPRTLVQLVQRYVSASIIDLRYYIIIHSNEKTVCNKT